MRLSELNTDKVTDVLCEITPYVANIVTDDELLTELKRAIKPGEAKTKAELLALGAKKITTIVPIVLKKRKEDVFGIIGALNEKSAQEIGEQNFIITMKQIRELIKDKELLDFFKSCVGSEGNE